MTLPGSGAALDGEMTTGGTKPPHPKDTLSLYRT